MKEIVFATNNAHKLAEIKTICAPLPIEVKSLKDIGFHQEIEEPFNTLEENALQKASVVSDFCGLPVFADDTGLFVDALNGAPGVFSARYAGENCSFKDNITKLLSELKGVVNRECHFKTIIAFIDNKRESFFEGRVDGEITSTQRGKDGFGYDPVFIPSGFDKTFAEMSAAEKNSISHRARALEKFLAFLRQTE